MRSIRRRGLLALPCLGRPATAATPPEPTALDLAGLIARLGAVDARSARFREERRLAALDLPLESEGTLHWRRPDRLEKVTTWPIAERISVVGSTLTFASAGQPARVLDLATQPELQVLIDALRAPLAGDVATLERSFLPTLRAGGETWTLRLVPRARRARALFDSIEIDGRGASPTEIRLTEALGDRQTLRLEELP